MYPVASVSFILEIHFYDVVKHSFIASVLCLMMHFFYYNKPSSQTGTGSDEPYNRLLSIIFSFKFSFQPLNMTKKPKYDKTMILIDIFERYLP